MYRCIVVIIVHACVHLRVDGCMVGLTGCKCCVAPLTHATSYLPSSCSTGDVCHIKMLHVDDLQLKDAESSWLTAESSYSYSVLPSAMLIMLKDID